MSKKNKVIKLSSLQADRAKELEGDWVAAPDLGPGVTFLVRSTFYPPFAAARDEGRRNLIEQFPDGIPEDDNARLLGELAVEHLLLNWQGFDEDYTPELARTLLLDESWRKLRWAVYIAASKVGQRTVAFVERAEKNSEPPSAIS